MYNLRNYILIAGFMGLFACEKPSSYPLEPLIYYSEFVQVKNSYGKDTIGILKFTFTDGDGDIGVNTDDTSGKFNLFINYYEFSNGEFRKVPYNVYKDTVINGDTLLIVDRVDTVNYNARIPNLTPSGNNKSIKGDTEVEIPTNIRLSDSVYYEFYIADKANHVSNIEKTQTIILY